MRLCPSMKRCPNGPVRNSSSHPEEGEAKPLGKTGAGEELEAQMQANGEKGQEERRT